MRTSGSFGNLLLWLKITCSAFFAGVAVGIIIFCYLQNDRGILVGGSITLFITVLGMILATKVCRKHSISQTDAG